MSGHYKFLNPYGLHFVSFSVVFWLSVFIRKEYNEILIRNLKYCQQNKGLNLFAYCIMPNHLHLVFSATNGNPSNILRDYKRATAKALITAIKENPKESRKIWIIDLLKQAAIKDNRDNTHQFWQHDNHPIEVWSNKVINQKINYIHQNPVKAGFVTKSYDWKYSSARNYMLDDNSIIVVIRV